MDKKGRRTEKGKDGVDEKGKRKGRWEKKW